MNNSYERSITMDLYEPSIIDTGFPFIAILILGIILFNVVRGIVELERNNAQPEISVNAQVIDKGEKKNTNIHYNAGDMTGAHGIYMTDDIFYYVTFQLENGEAMEFYVDAMEYEVLHKDDRGILSFQGTRFQGFQKE